MAITSFVHNLIRQSDSFLIHVRVPAWLRDTGLVSHNFTYDQLQAKMGERHWNSTLGWQGILSKHTQPRAWLDSMYPRRAVMLKLAVEYQLNRVEQVVSCEEYAAPIRVGRFVSPYESSRLK